MLTLPLYSVSFLILLSSNVLARSDEPKVSCSELASLSRGIPGAFVPTCESDGSFSSNQCHGSTGHCWCATPSGEEIIGSRTGPLAHRFDCARLPECFTKAHEARSRSMHGSFVPQCEADGSYQRQQCHSSTGHCWCVSPDGNEVLGTRHGPVSESSLDCSNLPPCLATAHLVRQRQVLGAYLPQCEADGSFSSQQCHSSTGYCWCVGVDGTEIQGTRRSATETKLECGDKVPTCLKMAHEARTFGGIGAYIPQCDDEGRFQSQQCHGSTGHCWCVASTADMLREDSLEVVDSSFGFKGEGVEIIGTRRGPSETRVDCEAIPKCFLVAHQARVAASRTVDDESSTSMVMIGAHVPQCEADGTFSTQQCRRSTGYCWCVSPTDGHEIEGSRRAPGSPSGQVDCNQLPSCLAAADRASQNMMFGTFVPQCNEKDASYLPRQCHASSGHCWCVDPEGRKIVGTVRSPVQQDQLTCVDDVPECALAAHHASLNFAPGSFTPQCEADGTFSSQQCHGSTGHCWCVDSKGREILGTRSGATEESTSCEVIPECLRQAHEIRVAQPEEGFVGSFIPQCESDGSFSSTQCHGSTGHCWCVDESGVEILGSRRTPSESRPECSRMLSKCQLEARRARTLRLPGMFVPVCESDGSYSNKQCHGSTGHCWCADSDGNEILGTRSTPNHISPVTSSCDRLHTCLLTAHNRRHQGSLDGAYIPQCDAEDGSFSNVQCHTSTGYCWCSTPEGLEISDTRVRFEEPQCPSMTRSGTSLTTSIPGSTDGTANLLQSQTEQDKHSSSSGTTSKLGGNGNTVAIGMVAGVVGSVIAAAVVILIRKRDPVATGPYAPLQGHNQA